MKSFHAARVSASEDGDYLAVQCDELAADADGKYFLLQRSFEDDDEPCYIEEDELEIVGHFDVDTVSAELQRDRLRVKTSDPEHDVLVTFKVDDRVLRRFARVLRAIIPDARIAPGLEAKR
jgi:hypothetical protein